MLVEEGKTAHKSFRTDHECSLERRLERSLHGQKRPVKLPSSWPYIPEDATIKCARKDRRHLQPEQVVRQLQILLFADKSPVLPQKNT